MNTAVVDGEDGYKFLSTCSRRLELSKIEDGPNCNQGIDSYHCGEHVTAGNTSCLVYHVYIA